MGFDSIGALWLNNVVQLYRGHLTHGDSKMDIIMVPVAKDVPRGPSHVINSVGINNNKPYFYKVGSLWTKVKGDKTFLSGVIEIENNKINILCFYSTSANEKAPDINIVIQSDQEGYSNNVNNSPPPPPQQEAEDVNFDDLGEDPPW